jgi:TonB family protein
MKRNLLYNFLIISLMMHLLPVLSGLADFGHPTRRATEPLVVDITGPVYAAPKTLPQVTPKEEPRPLTTKPSEPVKEIESKPPTPSSELTVPVAEKARQAQKEPALVPPPVPATEGRAEGGLNGTSPADKEGASGCTRTLLSQADLIRYAQAAESRRTDYLISSYLNRLSSLMDRRIDSLLKYSNSRFNDPSVEFIIRSGELESIEIVRSSGNEKLDSEVKQVLMDASPFTPLPDIWRGQDLTFVATINIY